MTFRPINLPAPRFPTLGGLFIARAYLDARLGKPAAAPDTQEPPPRDPAGGEQDRNSIPPSSPASAFRQAG